MSSLFLNPVYWLLDRVDDEQSEKDVFSLLFPLFVFWSYSGLIVNEAYLHGKVVGPVWLLYASSVVYLFTTVWLGNFVVITVYRVMKDEVRDR